MLFDTPAYLIFLAIVVTLYWRFSWRRQNLLLLACSYMFYGWWDWRFLLLMIGSTCLDYFLSHQIARSANPATRKRILIASLAVNFTVLGLFKYCNFFVSSFAGLLTVLGIHNVPNGLLDVVLPPGISFYTFQEVAYIADVYFGKLEPADSFLDYALFISLFPHLIAGPIQRPSHLLPQVQRERHYDPQAFFDGLMLIASGLFRRCVIADNCAVLANAAFAGTLGSGVVPVLVGVYAFSWQIYGDFSGYSDIARGSAQLLGFHFMVNFRQPYLASSLQDFWRRWHISLSTWLRDYLYIPLGGNRKGETRTYINLLLTMLLGGLWHGANWTFLVWGGIHGVWLGLERFFWRGEVLRPRWAARILTLTITGLAWVFFRARSVGEAWSFLHGLTQFTWQARYGAILIFLAAISSMMIGIDLVNEKGGCEYLLQRTTTTLRVAIAAGLALIVIFAGGSQANAFIYFQF